MRDCAAIVTYLAWLENELNVKNRTDISEYDGAMRVEATRK